ncbi:hypothetical protein CCHR01_09117 [Colletotrichum chrysophilum]|uniref:Uncharacterized protein n=1 Tax=Colletotrichum chrysophilum TaxID=1836956 RepID=A0AAD9EEG9_9PEZI|nr:hypothetical protein CCHR01_09117 [Colletotrichum chrysophilum]
MHRREPDPVWSPLLPVLRGPSPCGPPPAAAAAAAAGQSQESVRSSAEKNHFAVEREGTGVFGHGHF